MFGIRRGGKRFSLLLLEEEEDYVQDWVVDCKWPANVTGNWQGLPSLSGRLRLCTKSIFFEPDDVRIPIARLPFVGMEQLDAAVGNSFMLSTNTLTKMKANMEEVPYVFEKGTKSVWTFTLSYAQLSSFLPAAKELLDISRKPKMERTALLEAMVCKREDTFTFDTSRLVDFGERILYSGPAVQLTPLVRERGHLVVTEQRVYFQPLHNVAGAVPVRSHPLAAIAAVARRRSSLRPIGLELFFIDPDMAAVDAVGAAEGAGEGHAISGPTWDAPSAFFSFRTEAEREAAAQVMLSQPVLGRAAPQSAAAGLEARGLLLEAHGAWLQRVTAAWQHGRISNFDYLLYLNLAAGRSFNDLAQWPVFPWVLSNYRSSSLDLDNPANFRDLSKPVGALNPDRLAEFKKRFRDMPDDSFEGAVPPFLYGTHYSTPGYVMYWLVRAAPAHMLRLQNGRFDAPDRLFAGIQESWESVNQSTTDVKVPHTFSSSATRRAAKELIPEFFLPNGDFLLNLSNLPLGCRQNGRPVGDVELPPWATNPEDFLAKHRAALESPHVSAHLHAWVDLVFGYKQRGPAAEAADNMFFYLTYEGAVDINTITNPIELKALETQINEFGQTPKQLFEHPHPPRLVIPPAPEPSAVFAPTATSCASDASRGIAASSSGGLSGHLGPRAPHTPSKTPRAGAGGSGGSGATEGDAGNRALALALVHTIIAAADPESAAAAAAAVVAGGAELAAVAATPAPAGQLLPAAADGSTAPAKATAATAKEAAASSTSSSSSSSTSTNMFAGLLKLGRYQQQQLGGVPTNSTGSTAASTRPSLWMPSIGTTTPSSTHGILPTQTTSITSPPPPNTALPDSRQRPKTISPNQRSTTTSSFLMTTRHAPSWGRGLPDKLWNHPAATLHQVSKDALHAVVLWHTEGPSCSSSSSCNGSSSSSCFVGCVGANGVLRVLPVSEPAGSTFRSVQLAGDLQCLACVPWTARSTSAHRHPLLLAGSHNRKVYAYAVDAGRVVGCFDAHDDAVCCVAIQPSASGGNIAGRFMTASWDCSVKVWSLAEGRCPWSYSLLQPELELRDFDAGVWALAVGQEGSNLVVTGTEEGLVSAWDLRSGKPTWQVSVADDYIGGLTLTPCGKFTLVAAADGVMTLLDCRQAGSRLAHVATDAPLRCVTTDGGLGVAGSEVGSLQLWDVAQMSAAGPYINAHPPAPDGLYPAWGGPSAGIHCSINAIAVEAIGSMDPESCDSKLALALDDGSIALVTV